MNIITDLADRIAAGTSEKTLTREEEEALAKQERIKFHRRSVRCGPVKFREPTSGQIRRARHRDLRSMTKKARKHQISNYFAQRREAASLRHRLQAVGILEYSSPEFFVPEQAAHASALWLVGHFGDKVAIMEQGLTVPIVEIAFLNALNRYEELSGLPKSDELPDDYEVSA
jgi:hypothetical protein